MGIDGQLEEERKFDGREVLRLIAEDGRESRQRPALELLCPLVGEALAGVEKIVYCNSDTQLLLQQASSALSQAINPGVARANK